MKRRDRLFDVFAPPTIERPDPTKKEDQMQQYQIRAELEAYTGIGRGSRALFAMRLISHLDPAALSTFPHLT
jgi:hypothetical protein